MSYFINQAEQGLIRAQGQSPLLSDAFDEDLEHYERTHGRVDLRQPLAHSQGRLCALKHFLARKAIEFKHLPILELHPNGY